MEVECISVEMGKGKLRGLGHVKRIVKSEQKRQVGMQL